MAIYDYNDKVTFDLPDDYELQSEINDDGDEIFTVRGEFYLDDDFERQSKYSCRISEGTVEWDEESKGKTMRQLWTDGFATKENIRYVVLQDRPAVLFSTMGQSMLMFGREFRMMATTVFVEVAHDQFLILIGITPYNEEEPDHAVAALEKMRKVLGALRINGKIAVESIPDAEKLFSAVKPCYDGSEPIDTGVKLNITVNGAGSSTTYEYGSNSQEPTITSFSLNRATPDEKLYPHYSSMKFGPAAMLSTMGAQVNATGTEYSFQALSKELDTLYLNPEDGPSEEHKEVLRRIVNADTGYYDLHKKAEQMIPLFRVDSSVFDTKHDRECELADGLMHRSYMMSALRSFAWSLTDWCTQKAVQPADLTYDELNRIISFVSMQDWLNYDETYCTGLCGCPDLHVYYVPDSASALDKQALLPSADQLAEIEEIKKNFPNFNQILSEVHSLDDLRKDLEYIFPAIETIYAKLAEDRDHMQPLTGDAADILYAWCALTLAAKEPFFTEDGPMNCWFEQKNEAISPYIIAHGVGSAKGHYTITDKDQDVSTKNVQLIAPAGCKLEGTELTEYDSSVSRVVIPEGVTKINYLAFYENTTIREVVIPGTLDGPVKGFENCTSLQSAKLAEGIKTIGGVCFADCSALKTVQLPSTLQQIEVCAFSGCSSLQEIQLPKKLTAIGVNAFSDCSSLKILLLPDGLMHIGERAFSSCTSLRDITIPKGISAIAESTFFGCENLETVNFSENIKEIGGNAFSQCNALKMVTIPRGVEAIGEYAFAFCDNLREIYIPATVKTIGQSIVSGCDRLKRVHVEEGSFAEQYCKENYIKYDTYYDGEPEITLPPAPELPENWEQLQQTVTVEEIMDVEDGILRKCVSANDHVVIPEGIIEIGESACEDLIAHSVHLPDSLKKIGTSAFAGSVNLDTIIIPEGVTEIGERAFSYCPNLQNIIIPDSVTTIGKRAFNNCAALQTIVLPKGLTILPDNCFGYCVNLIHVVLPASLTTIEQDVFCKCISLRSLLIPENVTFIGDLASYDFFNSGLRELVILGSNCELESVRRYMNIYAPAGSQTMELLKKHDRVKAYVLEQWKATDMARISVDEYDYRFNVNDPWRSIERAGALRAQQHSEDQEGNVDKCATKYVDIMDSVRVICADAYNDSALVGVFIPDSVEEIQNGAFSNCVNLRYVRLPAGMKELEEHVLTGCPLNILELPADLRRIEKNAFGTTDAPIIVFPEKVECIDANMFDAEEIYVKKLYVAGMKTRILGDWSVAEKMVEVYAYPGSAAQRDAVNNPSLHYVELKADMIPQMDVKAEIERHYQQDLVLYRQSSQYIQSQLNARLEDMRKRKEKQARATRLFILVNFEKHSTYRKEFEFPVEYSLKINAEHTFFNWRTCNRVDNEEKEIDGLGAAVSFACNFNSAGNDIGGLYDALVECYGEKGDDLIEQLYEELGNAVKNDAAVSIVLYSLEPDNGKMCSAWAVMDYTTLTLQEGKEEWIVSESEAIEKAKSQMDAMAMRCQKAAEEKTRKREEEARKRAEEVERKRQEELAKKRIRYNEINEGISMQMQIIAQNKGWFGAQAKARKAAQEQLAILQAQLTREFPNGKP